MITITNRVRPSDESISTKKQRRLLALALPWFVIPVQWLYAESPLTFTGPTMGTQYTICVFDNPEHAADESLERDIRQRLERVNQSMSTWLQDSELSRFNRHRDADWFDVSAETANVVHVARQIAHDSKGAFDVTVGPLVNLWQFGPEQRSQPPTADELDVAMNAVGIDKLEVRLNPPALRKSKPELYVDLSAIAKGFGVDEIARLLESRGLASYMVEIGGEIRVGAEKPNGAPWTIGIEAPFVDRRAVQRRIELSNAALATSGDYRNFRELEQQRVSHAIDPRTGRPIQHDLASVTVIADNCMEADAWATALLILGPLEAFRFSTTHDLAVLLMVREGNRWVEQATPAFIAQTMPYASRGQTPPEAQPIPLRVPLRSSPIAVILITMLVFSVALTLMAVGVLFGRRRLRGTCGGLTNLRDEAGHPMCDACSHPPTDCLDWKNREGRAL